MDRAINITGNNSSTSTTDTTKYPASKTEYIQEINILLLGETGVGKSTFINAFVNYLTYENLRDAEIEELTCLIPTKFTIADENYQNTCTIEIGKSKNESQEMGASATQSCKSYVFQVDDIKVRLIDTPGIGDTRGIDQDEANFDNILTYLGEFKELHGICILLKPNNARLTIVFRYCVKHLLSKLQKSASKNIVFLFTNSRSTFYRPGDTFIPLKKILEEIESKPPHIKIPCAKENIFCIDNEAFRFLAALKHMSFSEEEKREFEKSWKKSSDECWRMLKYIAGVDYNGLIPHRVQDTVSINEARRVIVRLTQPLAEVAQLIQNNLIVLQRHRDYLAKNTNNLKELQGKLYIPVVNVRVTKMSQPRTTCTAPKCTEIYKVKELKMIHYKQLCHSPCSLQNIPKEIIGDPGLVRCWAMGGTQNCRQCGCSYRVHQHIYYTTEAYDDKIVDQNIDTQISKDKIEASTVQKKIQEIEGRSKEYAAEQEIIIKTTAKFAHFLQNNAITPYNDAYKQYLEYLIDREKNLLECDRDMIKHYERLLLSYEEQKRILDDAFKMANTSTSETTSAFIVAGEIFNDIKSLYSLTHTGAKIKELYDKQENARSHELTSEEEYIHPKPKRRNRILRLIFGN